MLPQTKIRMPNQEAQKLCGNRSPGLIVVNSNTVTLDYRIDDKGQSAGWSLDYSTKSESKSSTLHSYQTIFQYLDKKHTWLPASKIFPDFDLIASQE